MKETNPKVCRNPYCECSLNECQHGLPDRRGEWLGFNPIEKAVDDVLKTGTDIYRIDPAMITKGAGTRPEDMATGGVKYDTDKPRMDLLDAYAIEQLALVLGFGSKKYSAWNWKKGIAKSRLIAAALRHLFAYLRGEDKDPETGLSHAAHAMCCCMFLLGLEHRIDLDDRWKENNQ